MTTTNSTDNAPDTTRNPFTKQDHNQVRIRGNHHYVIPDTHKLLSSACLVSHPEPERDLPQHPKAKNNARNGAREPHR